MISVANSQATGNNVQLITSDSRHFNDKGEMGSKKEQPAVNFSKVLFDSVNEADSLQQQSDNLEQQMILDPESVNIDQVMIASEKARLSVSFLKSISEKAVRAYNDIMMIR